MPPLTVPGLGRVPHPETPEAEAAYPVRSLEAYSTSTRTYRYYWERGAWLDQGNTGTCVGHAFAHRRADSPVPTGEIDEAYALKLYLDASGDTTYQVGTSGLAACRVLAQRGTISQYHWITSPTELRNTLLTVGSVCVGTDWYGSMFTPVFQYGNAYLTVDTTSGIAGGHEYLINGINVEPSSGLPYYRMKNSWGQGWGYNGTARIYCKDLDWLLFQSNGDAVIITET
jgi:hypothetical protein